MIAQQVEGVTPCRKIDKPGYKGYRQGGSLKSRPVGPPPYFFGGYGLGRGTVV